MVPATFPLVLVFFQMASHQPTSNPHAGMPGMPAAAAHAGPVDRAAGLAWTNPKDWPVAASSSTMRVVTLKVPKAPKEGWALRGAIAAGPGGNVFFKLVGPRKTVERAQPAFDALVKSLRKG